MLLRNQEDMIFINNKHQITMDVLCVAQYSTYYLAGIGNYLFIYEDGSLCTSQAIFLNERVHNIYAGNENKVLVKGGKQLALVKLEKTNDKLNCNISAKIHCSDWIQDAVVMRIDNSLIGLTTAHNLFEVWNMNLKKKMNSKSCTENCILYCCKILGTASNDIIVFSGTAFGNIVIWNPFIENQEETLLQRFEAHSGAVFSIEISTEQKVMTTTSDDRSLRIWSIDSSESLRTPDAWKKAVITPQHTLFGHKARVWRSLIVSQFYVTVGEDSNLIIWRNDGSLVRTICLHQKSGIRGLYYSKDKCEIITGGEDGGINSISWKNLMEDSKVVESIIFPSTGMLIDLPFPGYCNDIHFNAGFSTKICFIKNGYAYTTVCGIVTVNAFGRNSYFIGGVCVLEPSPCGYWIALGCTNGQTVLLGGACNVVGEERFCRQIDSIHWLHSKDTYKILICHSKICLCLYSLFLSELLNVFELPGEKNKGINCALINVCNDNENLIVGDRMGNVYMFYTGSEFKHMRMPFRSFKNFHDSLGVTDMIIDTNHDQSIKTVGRDGTIKTISFGKHTSTNKLPMDWPWKIFEYNGDKLIVGFRSDSVLIWSTKYREVIANHKCGGGHRPCHCRLHNDKFKLLCFKRNKFVYVELKLDGIKRLRQGFHGKMVNSLKTLMTNPPVIVTGSEDTTLRISRMFQSDVKVLETFKTHLSSIRAVATCSSKKDRILIFSAGGRAQLIIWKFNCEMHSCKQLLNYRLKKDDKNWKCYDPTNSPNSRFMCLDVCKNKGNQYLVVVGSSDRQIKLFLFDYDSDFYDDNIDGALKQLCSTCYTHCILKITLLKVKETIYIVSMGNDGKLVFFRASENLSALEKYNTFRLHQSGINSFAFKQINPGKYVMISGGDDNKISGSIVTFEENEVKLSEKWSNSNIHSCQVTGIEILEDILITTSTDQRITLWKMDCVNDEIRIQYKDQRLTSVPDVQGLNANWCSGNTISVIVYGKGIEMLEINCEANENHD